MPDFIHFVGIGGIGVSALAQVAQARGARVSGSDTNIDTSINPALARLAANGAACYQGHRRENVAEGVTLVVTTAAVNDRNPEIAAARLRGIPVVSRAAYLGTLMSAHQGPTIAVAGTHGKTTTTAMIGVMLQHAGLDPTVFVGGEVDQLGGNVRIGGPTGPFVAEACEAYDSFLHLRPDIAIVTNVEADHLDHYGTEDNVFAAFDRFLDGITPNGFLIACGDDDGVRRLLDRCSSRRRDHTRLYAIENQDAHFQAERLELGERSSFFLKTHLMPPLVRISLAVPGRHNVRNALAAAVVGTILEVPPQAIGAGLGVFRGADRRQDLLGKLRLEQGTALVFDDYAHHPTEIRATIEAMRGAYPGRRLAVVFQPHLYSRTRDFLDGFAEALAQADVLVVTDIYAAREARIAGVNAADIVELALRKQPGLDARYVADKNAIPREIAAIVRPDDVLVFMGAGDIREQGEKLVASVPAETSR